MERQRAEAGTAGREFLALFGARVEALRMEQGLSLAELATLSGVSKSHLWAIEKGRSNATERTLVALARGLGIAPLYLVISLDKQPPAADEIERTIELMRLLPLDVVRAELLRVMPNAPRFRQKPPGKTRV